MAKYGDFMQTNNRNNLDCRRHKQLIIILKSKHDHFKEILERRKNGIPEYRAKEVLELIASFKTRYERFQRANAEWYEVKKMLLQIKDQGTNYQFIKHLTTRPLQVRTAKGF